MRTPPTTATIGPEPPAPPSPTTGAATIETSGSGVVDVPPVVRGVVGGFGPSASDAAVSEPGAPVDVSPVKGSAAGDAAAGVTGVPDVVDAVAVGVEPDAAFDVVAGGVGVGGAAVAVVVGAGVREGAGWVVASGLGDVGVEMTTAHSVAG